MFFDRAEARSLPRPSARTLLLAAGAGTLALAALLLATRDGPPAPAAPPEGLSAVEAERRLELRFGSRHDEGAAVRCPRGVEYGSVTRCVLRYSDGIARPLMVRLSAGGDLAAEIPYPATLRR